MRIPGDDNMPNNLDDHSRSSAKRLVARRSFQVFRFGFGLSLLGLLLTRISVNEIFRLFGQTMDNWHFLVLAFMMPGVGLVISSLRLKTLLKAQGVEISHSQVMNANFVGSFYNQMLPSTIGGDVARGYWISRLQTPGSNKVSAVQPALFSFTVIGVDRFVGVIGILVTALLAALAAPSIIRQSTSLEIILVMAVAGVFFIFLLLLIPARSFGKWVFSISLLLRLREKAVMIYNALQAYNSKKSFLLYAFLLSVGLQFSTILQYWFLVQALRLGIPFLGLAILVPIVSFISMIPITINGIGIRENVLYTIGASIGFTISGSVALAYIFLCAKMMWAMPGGIMQLKTPRNNAEIAPATGGRFPDGRWAE